MQARFDFAGTLIPPTEDLPTHLGLHHHGEEPEVSRQQVRKQKHLNFFLFILVYLKDPYYTTFHILILQSDVKVT